MDKLIELLKVRRDALEFLGQVWELLYLEGKSPDVGIRRENFIRLMLENELNLKVEIAPPMERSWDFKVLIDDEARYYSLKTAENISPIKTAWNGFPTIERARRHQFKHPILYVKNDRRRREMSIFVFTVEDLLEIGRELRDRMWWIPRGGTNPRGFGISRLAVKRLMEMAVKAGNYVGAKYESIEIANVSAEYWREWYGLLKRLSRRKFGQPSGGP